MCLIKYIIQLCLYIIQFQLISFDVHQALMEMTVVDNKSHNFFNNTVFLNKFILNFVFQNDDQ